MRLLLSALLTLAAFLPTVGCIGVFSPVDQATVAYFRDPARRVRKPVRSWKALREENVVMQRRDYSCGPACLATVIRYYWGDDVTEDEFLLIILLTLTREQLEDRIKNGLSMTDLRRAAVARGYLASMGRRRLADLPKLRIPVIVRIKKDQFEHFVVLRGIVDDRVFLADPIRGNIRMSIEEFAQQWTDGVILVVVKPGTKLPEDAPLARLPSTPAQPEMQAAKSALFVHPRVETRITRP